MPVILRWISGDQIQVQVLEMAVQELKPDAEPPALDSPVTWPNFVPRESAAGSLHFVLL